MKKIQLLSWASLVLLPIQSRSHHRLAHRFYPVGEAPKRESDRVRLLSTILHYKFSNKDGERSKLITIARMQAVTPVPQEAIIGLSSEISTPKKPSDVKTWFIW